MNHHKFLSVLLIAAVTVTPAQATGLVSATPADTVKNLVLSVTELNAALNEYAYQELPTVQAQRQDAALVSYLSGLGLQHTWQQQVSGDLYDAWYSAQANITVIVVHVVQAGNTVNQSSYAAPGFIRKGQQPI